MVSAIFTAEEFWKAFSGDLMQAQARVLVQSPFLSARRLKLLASGIRSLGKRGVTCCAFVQEPRDSAVERDALDTNTAYELREFSLALEMLRSWGAHVNLRKSIHAKLAIIDEKVLWEGSLNILSHSSTREHMRRFASRTEVQAVLKKLPAESSRHALVCGKDVSPAGTHLTVSQPIIFVQLTPVEPSL